ncbi:MAG TPA: PQQ-binding-like beta-propeller repeat protein [Spirochaetota bacterium]|nr:PQQ-binding-like beta-propeller repeat protein [Spirochaetota bacterium]
MKFLTSDSIFVGASALLITSLSILLYADFNRKVEAGNVKQIGTITFKRQVAQRKYLAQVVWEDVEQDVPVYNNDSIRTATDSEAVIHLGDGTDINIDENSMIMLSTLEDEININFEHGTISANRSGVSGVDIAAINIRSQDTTVSIDKSNIQLTQMDNQSLDLTVSDGTAKVSSGKEETLVNTNEKALISADRKETKIVKLNFILKEPGPDRFYMLDAQSGDIIFIWDAEGNVQDFTLEISGDRDFKKLLVSRKTGAGKQTVEKLNNGMYYWRVSAFNGDTKQAEYSEIRKVNLLFKKPVKPVAPVQGELISQTAGENSVSFRWIDDELANDYELEISQDKEFKTPGAIHKTRLKNIVIDNLAQGEYYWRVKSNITTGIDSFSRTSLVSSFRVEKGRMLNPPVLVTPATGDSIDLTLLKGKGIMFSWNNDPGYSGYEIEISRNETFTDLVTSGKRNVNFLELKDQVQPGKFYWRVRGVQKNTNEKNTSLISVFDVVAKENIVLVSPAEGAEFKIPAEDNKTDVKFSWNPVNAKGNYKIQVSKNRDFSDIKVNEKSLGSSTTIALDDSGEYYWRVLFVDEKGAESIKSISSRFKVFTEEKKTGKSFVLVKSPVAGSRIYINSKYKGQTSVKQDVSPDQKIQVRVVTKSFYDYNTRVTVKEGETLLVTPKLEKVRKLQRVKWSSAFKSPVVSAPVYAKDRIITLTEDGTVTVLNKSGSVVFSSKVGKRFDSKAVVYKNNAYFVDVKGMLYSLDIVQGKINWKVTTKGPALFKTGPVVVDDIIYVASNSGTVSAFDLTGKNVWENNLDEGVYNSIMVYKSNVIIATDTLTLYALNAEDGDEEWSADLDDRVITLTPLAYSDNIYFGCYSGKFYSINADTGDLAWTFMTGGPIYSSPALYKKSILFGSDDGYLYSLDYEKGTLIWKFKAGSPVNSSPIVAFESVFVTADRTLFALDPVKGTVLWQNSFDSRIKTSPAIADDTVILGLANGRVVSVRNTLTETVEK